jgi:anti-sigma regulatory factor (Ser/Thr protein kinase)
MERAATQEPGRGAASPGSPAPAASGAVPSGEPDGRLRLRHPAELSQLRAIRREVAGWAGAQRLTDDELIDLQLAIGEAVSNGIEHGYRDGVTGPVEVDLAVRADGPRRLLDVRVVDHGRWRPAPRRPGHRGRGLAMIRGLAVDMRVTNDSHGTTVTFTVPLAR